MIRAVGPIVPTTPIRPLCSPMQPFGDKVIHPDLTWAAMTHDGWDSSITCLHVAGRG